MRKRTLVWAGIAALLVAVGGWYASLDKETRGLLAALPTNRDVLSWTLPQRDAAFRAMDRITLLADARTIQPSAQALALPQGRPLEIPGVDDFCRTAFGRARNPAGRQGPVRTLWSWV